jgi:two-component system, OmpR family, response regulator
MPSDHLGRPARREVLMGAHHQGPTDSHLPSSAVTLLSVLVVDDVPDAARSLAEFLALCGFVRVSVAGTGKEALELADDDPPDVVLLDIGLPDLNGWEVARWLREQAGAKGKQPFLIAVTGFGSEDDRRRSAVAGMDLHLVKPADPGVVVGVLRRFSRILAPGPPAVACEEVGG